MTDTTSDNGKLLGFLYGAGLSIVIVSSFLFGAWADRVFVVKPIDYLVKRTGNTTRMGSFASQGTDSALGKMLDMRGVTSVADVAAVASKSVVTVSIKKEQTVAQPYSLFIPGFGGSIPAKKTEVVQRDIGSGFVVENGLVVTNKHVVTDAQAEFKIIDSENKEYPVTNIYRDPINDLAILQIEGATLPSFKLGDSDSIRVGESVIAIGTALGEFRHTVTTGVISGLGRGITARTGFTGSEELDNVIQTDAAINPGNSGGPLLNANGEVVGVNVAVTADAQNIGFALPINLVKASIDNFNKTGQFDRPFFGVRYQFISTQQAISSKIPQGALVTEVVKGSSAELSGIKVEDIILEVDGNPLKERMSLAEIVSKKRIGDVMTLKYSRAGKEDTIKVTLDGMKK
ncbi:trypsin-like peptidase domain-containing protein [Candidatus Woesebacteria bacterium]|nr:trypsin-like peptidase domain-containing protein [Candidatus Woesebacteria bacterium]